MGFESLLGNDLLKQNLTRSLRNGHISHFYLLSGPRGSGKHTLAGLLAAAILCRGENRPCLRCAACRKVMENLHPDFITIDDPERKTVPVDLIREARTDIYVQPNESDHKIYLFPRAQDIGPAGQNALLKILEEPPAYGVFLLLTDNPEKLLPTVRSRCTELKLLGLPDDILTNALRREFPNSDRESIASAAIRSGGFLGQARQILEEGGALAPQTEDFIKAFCSRDSLALIHVLVPMERMKRDALAELLQQWLEQLQNALAVTEGGVPMSASAAAMASRRSSADLYQAVLDLRKAIDYTQSNVSPAAVCGYLEWVLR